MLFERRLLVDGVADPSLPHRWCSHLFSYRTGSAYQSGSPDRLIKQVDKVQRQDSTGEVVCAVQRMLSFSHASVFHSSCIWLMSDQDEEKIKLKGEVQ